MCTRSTRSLRLLVLLASLVPWGSRRACAQSFDCLLLNDNNTNLFVPPDACFDPPDGNPWCDCLRSAFTHPVRGEASGLRQAVLWISQQPGIGNHRIEVHGGSADFSRLEAGDVIGRGGVDELIPLGFPFVGGEFFSVDAEARVTAVSAEELDFAVVITRATRGVTTAIFYDPTDAEHSSGHLFTGRMRRGEGGTGLVVEYRYATENFSDDPERFPALEPGEVSETVFTVPFLFEFFSAESGVYRLPDAGAVDITTTLRSFVESSISGILPLGAEDLCADSTSLNQCKVIEESIPLRGSLAENNPPQARIDPIDAGAFVLYPEPVALNTFCGRAVVLLRGRNSDDGDGGFQGLTYDWSVVRVPPGAAESAARVPEETRRFKDTHVFFFAAGEYEVALRIDDGGATESSDEATIVVTVTSEFDFNAPPAAVISVTPDPPSVALAGGLATVRLDGSRSDTGADGCPQELRFMWRARSGPAAVELTAPQEPVTEAKFRAAGTYEIELEVDDGGHDDNLSSARVEVEVHGDAAATLFRRGDSDDNGVLNITDSIDTLNWLFRGDTAAPGCLDAVDADDNGGTNITDAIYALAYLFLGGPAPPAPGPQLCGEDSTADELSACLYRSCGP